MAFDFKGALERAKKDADSTSLEAMVLGPSGAGKSYRAGTFGCKTLYLYSGGESHGVRAAKQEAEGLLVPVRYDHDANGSSDATLANLLEILRSKENIEKLGIKAIYVDGASELEFLIRSSSQWKELCKSAKGAHNSFEEPKATITMFRPIIVALKDLQAEFGMHIAMSCIVDVKEYGPSGEIIECQPRILGYGVAESLIQQFGDTLVTSKLRDQASGKTAYKFQFMTDVVKTAKEESGIVKKSINFSPRISGVRTVPAYLPANLSEVIRLKVENGSR